MTPVKEMNQTHAPELLGIPLPQDSKKTILEKVDFALFRPREMVHVVSLNPENLVVSTTDPEFKEVLRNAHIHLIDGIGVRLGALLKGIPVGERWTGADFMDECIKHVAEKRLRIVFLGGKAGLAEKVASCYSDLYPSLSFYSLMGIKDINNYSQEDEGAHILQHIHTIRPHIIFASFGSPFQEKWLWRNREELRGILCAGVGGAFEFASGTVPRAPKLVRLVGLEWLYRLMVQPWRWRRQLRLLNFLQLVLGNKS